ncbi:methionyl-tRNA formyltransferase [uncultured Thermanaerothrix sp.]|uniref:methionyl-tRNA formyltransferase n=1 Tax=uncultured Thermanaerothrix sp. TaxID=1195149 RepID=UPI002613B3CC|nr:methionyl-tRNA formyltransferase [uncultured Thermanaerothrix sp.]
MKALRVVFMGSPDFALPALRELAAHYSVVGVVTQPDRPAGRGQKLTPPPVKVLAQSLGLPIIQPERLRQPEALAQLQAWQPDLIVVAAFGQILRQDVLDLPPYGCINVHASLLPRWRGAAPIQAALLHGDVETGVTIMKMDAGVDTGPILSQRREPIREDDNAGTLSQRLAELGAQLLIETLPEYIAGRLVPQPQDERLATYAPMLKKEDGRLDCQQPAEVLVRKVRAFTPWPGAFLEFRGAPLKVLRAHKVDITALQPGQRGILDNCPAIGTVAGSLVLDEVQPAGKRPMAGADFLRGARDWINGEA